MAVAAHVLSLVGGFLVLLAANRDQWFFGDEWDFLARRGVVDADRSIWAAHTEHWSTAPILIYRALYSLYGLHSYVPYVVVLVLVHLIATHLLWQLMRQMGVDVPLATALTAVFVILGAGAENLLWAFQIGFIGSVALGLGVLLLVNHEGGWKARDVVGWFLSVAGLMFSGVSVTMVAVAGLTVLMGRGLRHAVYTVAVPGGVYLVWFLLVGQDNLASDRGAADALLDYPEYIWTGLRAAMEQAVGFPGAGALIVLGLAAFLLRRADHAVGPAAPGFACALGALVMLAIIAAGRSGLGVEQAEASRYTYIVVALALPAMGLALSELAGQVDGSLATPGRRLVICLLLVLVALHNGGLLQDKAKEEKRLEQTLKARILAAAQLITSPAVVLGGMPEPEYSPDIEVDDLRRMKWEGKLPTPTRITPADRIAVATVLQYAVNLTPLPERSTAPLIDGVVGATDAPDGAGCVRVFPSGPVPEIHLVGGDPMSVRVTTDVSGELTGYLRLFTPTVITGAAHVDKVKAGVPVFVNVTASVDQVVLRIPASGTTQVCGVL